MAKFGYPYSFKMPRTHQGHVCRVLDNWVSCLVTIYNLYFLPFLAYLSLPMYQLLTFIFFEFENCYLIVFMPMQEVSLSHQKQIYVWYWGKILYLALCFGIDIGNYTPAFYPYATRVVSLCYPFIWIFIELIWPWSEFTHELKNIIWCHIALY